MSVIQRIRDKAAWFVFGAIALSLIAFILQDAFSRQSSIFSSTSTLGKVNGIKLEREEYDHKLDFYEKANNTPRSQLMGSIWDYMVDQALMQEEYNKLGIKVNTDELSDVMFGDNPPQWMQQAFTNPQTGEYDAAGARQQFAQIKKNSNDARNAQLYEGYIEPTINQTLRDKYQSLITGAVYIPKWMAEKTNADNNALAKITYVTVPYASISDSTIHVSDDEIEAYIKKQSKQFEQKEETRQISYVSFDATPSASDTQEVLSQLNILKPELAAAADVKSFLARNNTDIPLYNGFRTKAATKPATKDTVFSLATGAVYGPYEEGGAYALAKMIDKKQLPDSVKVRHILVATSQQQQDGQLVRTKDDSTAKHRLDSAVALLKAGVSFDSVCAVYSDDGGSKNKGGVYDYFASGTMMEEFNDFAFTHPVGAKDIVKTAFGYHYIEVLGQKGSEPAYKIAFFSKPVLASQETVNEISTAAIKFASTSKTQAQFNDNAKKLSKSTQLAADIKANDFTIQGIGESRQLVKWIAENDPGDISEAIEVGEKYVVAMILSVNKAGLQNPSLARAAVEPLIRNEKKAKQILTKFKGNTLEEISRSTGAAIQAADSISYQAYIITGIGNEPKIIGASFNKQLKGKISAPIAGLSGVFAIRGENIFAVPALGNNAQTLKEQLQNQLKQQITYRSMTALKDAADIEDNRSKFY
ncbi:SurA N-terminal domain-containing protein [soil metagenome]